ncbi:MAG: amino acid decarboxylase [Ruminococcus sp.]
MNTPICDFAEKYAKEKKIRLHMPGHKGLGGESYLLDITEIQGADSLYEAKGIIAESEKNAGSLFSCDTFYSAEGSSLGIKAMLYLVTLFAGEKGKKPSILAARNAHSAFVRGCALLGIEVAWLCPQSGSYLACDISADMLREAFESGAEKPEALYITSPDYLGNVADIESIAGMCREFGVLLLVDNAHGAYLKFLPESRHPMDLGAVMCCDSAHKTLPVLTGGAYLHIAKDAPEMFSQRAKEALALFGSTSPSYLILQSLDRANKYISEGFPSALSRKVESINRLKNALADRGFTLVGNEPLKLTVSAKEYGYSGEELSAILFEKGIVSEFADRDFLVLMPSVYTADAELSRLKEALLSLERKAERGDACPGFHLPRKVMSLRDALLSPAEALPLEECLGRVAATPCLTCPPAVSVVLPGEEIDSECLKVLDYYGTDRCVVCKNRT